jgi:hypothetical protein
MEFRNAGTCGNHEKHLPTKQGEKMSINVTYKCDKCGAESKEKSALWHISLHARPLGEGVHWDGGKSMHVCRPCLEAMGINRTQETKKKDPDFVAPTLEELIREIVTRCVDIPNA